jgi:TPR repeat protein
MVFSHRLAGLVLALAFAGPALAQSAAESTLRVQLQSATWPADIVRLAGEYRARYPNGEFRATADAFSQKASTAAKALQSRDVGLYRNAFTTPPETAQLREDMRKAALADSAAAYRLARAHQTGAGVPADNSRYLGWLQYASVLGNDSASYELALHYRREAQPLLAARYETRAVELGYTPPRDLDHVRK